MAQMILDLYPDCVSQYGLLGCLSFSLFCLGSFGLCATLCLEAKARLSKN
jgi:hypothetical protein